MNEIQSNLGESQILNLKSEIPPAALGSARESERTLSPEPPTQTHPPSVPLPLGKGRGARPLSPNSAISSPQSAIVLSPELEVLTPAQTAANAEKLYPTHQRPTDPITARQWDAQKQHYITKRTAHEQERADLLNWAKTYAQENNLDLEQFVLNGKARRAYNLWQDTLRPPTLTTHEEIMAAAEDIFGNISLTRDDFYYWNRNRNEFIKQAQRRLQNYEQAQDAEKKRDSHPTPHGLPALAASPNKKFSILDSHFDSRSERQFGGTDSKGSGSPFSISPDQPNAQPAQEPVQQAVHEPVQNPVQTTQPFPSESFPSAPSGLPGEGSSAVKNSPSSKKPNYLPNQNALDADSPLGKFRVALAEFKTQVQALSETASPDKIREQLAALLSPILDLDLDPSDLPPSSVGAVVNPSPSEYDQLDAEIAAASKPRSKLDLLPDEKQEALFELLQNHDARKVAPKICKAWDITASASALNDFKKRYQRRLDAAERQKLQDELNELSSSTSDCAVAAEKTLQLYATQTMRDKKSTPEQIYKIITASTRFTNAQTAKARLELQKQKPGRTSSCESLTKNENQAPPSIPPQTQTQTDGG